MNTLKQRKVIGIILAGGRGERFGADLPKQFNRIAGKTVIEHTIEVFESSPVVDEIILVVNALHRALLEELLLRRKFAKISRVLNAGATRRESSLIGVSSISDADDPFVLVHDAVRPFVSLKTIHACVQALERYQAVDVAIPVADTVIEVDKTDKITAIPPRSRLRRGQTPQAFHASLLKEAHQRAAEDQLDAITDDCSLILHYNLAPIHVVEGSRENIKLTYASDIFLAERLYQIRQTHLPKLSDLGQLKDKTLVIFGGTRGIGRSIHQLATKAGASVTVLSRQTGCDIRHLDQIKSELAAIQHAEGKIDYVVNTAAILKYGALEHRQTESILEEVATNYLGTLHIIQAAAPYLRHSRGSLLLFTSSSYTRGRPQYAVYSSSKAAVVNLVQAVADEWGSEDMRINAICPQRTATPMRYETFGPEPPESLLEPETVAHSALQTLLSELSGQIIEVRKK